MVMQAGHRAPGHRLTETIHIEEHIHHLCADLPFKTRGTFNLQEIVYTIENFTQVIFCIFTFSAQLN